MRIGMLIRVLKAIRFMYLFNFATGAWKKFSHNKSIMKKIDYALRVPPYSMRYEI